MKKIMIAAAVAAVAGGVFAANCGPTGNQDTAWVYQWKFTGKTTTGAGAADVAGNCGPAGQNCTIRVPSSLKIQGYTYYCNPICSTTSFPAFAEKEEVFWQTKPFKGNISGGVTTEICHIIGRAQGKCEVAGVANFNVELGDGKSTQLLLTYAGLGKMAATDPNKHITSVSGNFAGTVSQPYYVGSIKVAGKDQQCPLAGYWECDTLKLQCNGLSVAYGKWSAKFKYAASENYVSGKRVALPSWVRPAYSK